MTADQTRELGMRHVLLVIVAAALMFSPTFISRMVYDRLGGDISVVALMALGLFLVGLTILLKVVKE